MDVELIKDPGLLRTHKAGALQPGIGEPTFTVLPKQQHPACCGNDSSLNCGEHPQAAQILVTDRSYALKSRRDRLTIQVINGEVCDGLLIKGCTAHTAA